MLEQRNIVQVHSVSKRLEAIMKVRELMSSVVAPKPIKISRSTRSRY
jgi:hypothetical protein